MPAIYFPGGWEWLVVLVMAVLVPIIVIGLLVYAVVTLVRHSKRAADAAEKVERRTRESDTGQQHRE